MSVTLSDVASENFEARLLSHPGGLMIALRGELDLAVVTGFNTAFDTAFAASEEPIILDFTELVFIDSSGLAAIIAALQRTTADGRPPLASGIRDQVRRVMDLVGALARVEEVERPLDTSPWPDAS